MRTALLCALLLTTAFARASTYYVTVAGLGGEPDYEQRFAAAAGDLDRVFKTAVGGHVYTLSGQAGYEGKADGDHGFDCEGGEGGG